MGAGPRKQQCVRYGYTAERRTILDGTAAQCQAPPTPSSATPSSASSRSSAVYDGRVRELCPHIIGTNKRGEEVVLAWQFGGESSGPLPQWRCLKLANVSEARPRAGRWHEGGSHQTTQTCVSDIDLDINVHVRKRR